jgi:hypothetical protein
MMRAILGDGRINHTNRYECCGPIGTLRMSIATIHYWRKLSVTATGDLTSRQKLLRVSSDHDPWHAFNGYPSQKQDRPHS